MIQLTSKQEKFCIAYLEEANASDAYRTAYNTQNSKPSSINRRAKELMDNSKIAARIAELRQPAVEAAQVTLEGHLRELEQLKMLAIQEGKLSAAIRAEELRGKVAGLYVDRIHHSRHVETDVKELSYAELVSIATRAV